MLIRRATESDIEAIMEIVHSAQEALAELGIDQWQDGYPAVDAIAEDIAQGVGYVACALDNTVLGYEAVVLTGEEAYTQLPDEAWHTPNNYVAVHRLCVSGNSRRKGIAHKLMAYACEHALRHNIDAFRIDTHEGNVRMLSLLKKLGFEYVGIVRYDSGKRMAFDLNITTNNKI